MNPNEQLIEEFYAAFAEGHANTMASCYHEAIVFQDPVFGVLKGKEVSDMWHMLVERSKGNLKIEFSEVNAHGNSGSAHWIATYHFSKTNREVVNKIYASFEFEDGLIIRHIDHFDLYKWSQQAFGLQGLLLGWTGFMQRKIQQQARLSLEKYRNASTD
jgi:ketosteroid isomerase-like protein